MHVPIGRVEQFAAARECDLHAFAPTLHHHAARRRARADVTAQRCFDCARAAARCRLSDRRLDRAHASIAEQATVRERRAALHKDEPRIRHGARVLRFVARSRHSFDRRNRPRRLLREQREQGRERGGDAHGMGLSAARAAELAEFSTQRRRARQHGPLGASAPRLTPRPIPCPEAPFPIGNKSRTSA